MKADITIRTPSRSYPLFAAHPFPADAFQYVIGQIEPDKLFLIIDEQVRTHHGEALRQILGDRISDDRIFVVPSGEQSKSIDSWKRITDFMLKGEVRRNSMVVAAGGGVTGDLAGFAAATTLRGLPLVHIPTTLLAMVDSSIGGKTGVNHEVGKNLVGSFFQPEAIFIHTHSLSTLPRNEWINGLSEILKYGAIRDPSIFMTCRELFGGGEIPDPSDPKLVELIRKCAKIKADVVEEDEKESGLRMILNFGHTFAHALERLGNYRLISHGEAVFAGMIAATRLSAHPGAAPELETLSAFSPLYNIHPDVFDFDIDDLIDAMGYDKKRTSSQLKLVLLHDWGAPYVTELDNLEPIREAWQYTFDFFTTSTRTEADHNPD